MTAAAEAPVADAHAAWPPTLVEDLACNQANGRVGCKLVSETALLRVWHITLAPGECLPFHRHVLDYFWTAVSPGRARSYYEDGSVHDYTYAAGDTAHFTFAPGEYMVHNLVNVGDARLSFVTVEHKTGANAALDVIRTQI